MEGRRRHFGILVFRIYLCYPCNIMTFIRHIPTINSKGPVVSIRSSGFVFGSEACRLAGLNESVYWIRVHLDHDERCIAFEFLSGDERPEDVYTLRHPGGSSRACATKSLIRNAPWVQAVAALRDNAARKFTLFRHPAVPKFWTIRLMAWFETFVSPKDIGTIGDAAGIYRYLDKNDEVIYIGKGRIADRFRSPERRNWGVVKIEYSVINGEDRQYQAEKFHLDRFCESNAQRLPYFNSNSGQA